MSRFFTRGLVVRLSVLIAVATVAVAAGELASEGPSGRAPTGSTAAVEHSLVDVLSAWPPAAPTATATPLAAPSRPERVSAEPAPSSATPSAKQSGSASRPAADRPARAEHRAARRAVLLRKAARARGFWSNHGGRDIGWPQCPRHMSSGGRHGLGQPMPDPGVEFVVVGLTNGRAFAPSPCLGKHLRWVRRHHVHAAAYAFSAYPTKREVRRYRHRGPYDGRHLIGALRNTGHAAARYNIRLMRLHGFTTPHVWLDVEPSSSRPWSRHAARNRAVVRGWISAYRRAGYTVGFYSTPHLWRGIVGRMRTGLPEWRTAGPVSARAARAKCHGESIQGGRAVLAQWWTTRRDFDRLCPSGSRARTMARYFHQW